MNPLDGQANPVRAGAISTQGHAAEVKAGARFAFGQNWAAFLRMLDDERVAEAERSLRTMLEMETLSGRTFLDVGCGSGLFSIAAMRLGASCVHSFDYDPQSVACAQELRRRFFPRAQNWTIEQGNALDAVYLRGLGQWDIVYSWGVLHHTGEMWQALDNVAPLVRDGGALFISLYNDQGSLSGFWARVKAIYNRGWLGRWAVLCAFVSLFAVGGFLKDLFLRRQNPLRRYRDYKTARGMSLVHDWIDWLGGYPFEVAQPEQVFDFYRTRGFDLRRLKTCGGGRGCNEYVFQKTVA